MALTTPFAQPLYETGHTVKHPGVLLASANVPSGTLAVNSSGKVRPYTAALAVAGAAFLGMSISSLVETTGSDYTPPTSMPFVFRRGCRMVIAGKSGDAPTAANIGGPVALYDNFTCQATLTSGYTQATLVEVRSDGYFEIVLS